MLIKCEGKVLNEWIRIRTLSTEENGELVLDLESTDPYYVPIPVFQLTDDDFFTARLINVSITDGIDVTMSVFVCNIFTLLPFYTGHSVSIIVTFYNSNISLFALQRPISIIYARLSLAYHKITALKLS